ncbi:expressed hypothetical protein [Trichoplax adhaerens]|uniref:Uncharacterized protein n=1 Tax=Trichoplax adhaerens TaxID=10228 RepID=B3S8F0_TRIAD|nr:expressed hypothetical protein [Trichoplax adhaerens]EDV20872.1 expressed hypothetical protein [Trichoplax adhaerens]|eukprot:XP_002116516.1 expressed hypothetical protein [Trichoplax adhaerens]
MIAAAEGYLSSADSGINEEFYSCFNVEAKASKLLQVRALHRLLEWRYHKQPWPSIPVTSANLIDHLLTRINQASGLYQMFGKLVDIIIIGHNHSHQYLEEVPVGIIPELKTETGRDIKNGFITLTFEYGKEFSGKGKDTLGPENYNHTAKTAHRSGNIHPIIRYYKNFIKSKKDEASIPPANKEHHVLEDFLTDWSVYNHHGHYINLFIQSILQTDLRHFYVKSCFELSMTFKTLPTSCDRTVIERSKLKT